MSKYDHYISIGQDCQPARHIRNNTGQSDAHFFDWLISPLQTVIKLVKEGPETLFRAREAFQPSGIHNNHTIMSHTGMGVIFYHDFPKVNPMAVFERVADKYAFLAKRWHNALGSGKRILLVRHHIGIGDTLALRQALYETHPAANIHVLAVNEGSENVDWKMPGIINANINPTSADWKGDITGWAQAMHRIL